MSILSYNGGAVLAMSGDQCVAIASDLRFGRELQTISTDFTKVSFQTNEARIPKIYAFQAKFFLLCKLYKTKPLSCAFFYPKNFRYLR